MAECIRTFVNRENVKKFATCLSYFYVTTLRISGSLLVTSNMHFQEIVDLSIMLDEMLVSDDQQIILMGSQMREKFNKYWGDPQKMNNLIFFAHVFDPTSKIKHLLYTLKALFGPEKGIKLFDTVNDKLTILFVEYEKADVRVIDSRGLCTFQELQNEVVSAQTPILPPPTKRHMSLMKAKFDEQNKGDNSGSRKSEMELYLSEATVENDDDFNILKWRKLNSERFPILSRMARDILVVPIYIVASE
ncbi:zinc finger BED domain-containing protein RICESLEEPER 2-like [Mercurialis annua]|uniref:zinc finger BED domain-containing protein RICESLEEPER 2-like n=1 Tax=Mercurialis annua TaxID=3986 RepID=UPI002160642D|nr:zinc finger BED domain-containing protein RICESLEEPER 2-like [Mercurialis annua]